MEGRTEKIVKKLEEIGIVVDKFEKEMQKNTESDDSDRESLPSDKSSDYLDPDLGKIEVPDASYLPKIIKYSFEYQAPDYSPLKLAPKAPNPRMEPEPDY